MADYKILKQELGEKLEWNKARIDFLAKFIIAMIQVRTVNFSEIANVLIGKAKEQSNYKRIIRFFKYFELGYKEIAELIVKLIGVGKPWVIAMDRTEWGYGNNWINILMLGICYKGVLFPLYWKVLEKKGNSNTEERIELVKEFVDKFGAKSIKFLAADREFIGQEWFKYLIKNNIDFRIRIKDNTLVQNRRGMIIAVSRLFCNLRINCPLTSKKHCYIWSVPLYLTGVKLSSGEFLIVVSPRFAALACQDYSLRWNIETLFGCLKSRGFRLEDSHLTDSMKLKKLIAILSIAFSWAFLVGLFLSHQKIIKLKKHCRPEKSIFRLGFDKLRRVFSNSLSSFDPIIYNILSST
jgi:hypothetical protein